MHKIQIQAHRVAYKNDVKKPANTNTNAPSCIKTTCTKMLNTNIELHIRNTLLFNKQRIACKKILI